MLQELLVPVAPEDGLLVQFQSFQILVLSVLVPDDIEHRAECFELLCNFVDGL